ncbi:MAG: aminotransferase class IV [Actinomycetota bacterium]|nr:aminotransferase class IV [Actinomycetota bacterium]
MSPSATDFLACVDGEVMPAAAATIPATDEGLLRGDGVFEVMRLYAGRPFACEDHLARMQRSAANLRLPLDVAAVRADVEALLERTGAVEALLRVLATRGGHRVALVEPLPQLPGALRLGLVTYAPTRVLDGIKSLSYAGNMLAGRLARERGFDEALLVTPHGRVLEAPTSSFFWVRHGAIFTPPLDDHILESITRARVMRAVDVREAPCAVDDVRAADEAFLASTVREVHPVSAVEDVELAPGGPVTQDAARRTRALIEAELGAAPAGG